MLDAFPNSWFGGKLKIPPCFHLTSRDAYLSGKVDAMRLLFQKQVLLDDDAELAAQLNAGVCTRLPFARSYILEQYGKLFKAEHPFMSNFEDWKTAFRRPVPTDNTSLAGRSPLDGPPSTLNTLSLDKSWLVTQLVSKYLHSEFYDADSLDRNSKEQATCQQEESST